MSSAASRLSSKPGTGQYFWMIVVATWSFIAIDLGWASVRTGAIAG